VVARRAGLSALLRETAPPPEPAPAGAPVPRQPDE
jgi:hypothetical protein